MLQAAVDRFGRTVAGYDETLDGKLVLPRGLADVMATVIEEPAARSSSQTNG